MIRTECLGCGKTYEKCECNTTLPPWETITGDPWEEEIDDFHETLTAMQNRIDVLLELNQHDDLAHTIPTILEDLFENCQRLVEDYAIES
jgi:hypothetical protein